jgi:hypothetical protein
MSDEYRLYSHHVQPADLMETAYGLSKSPKPLTDEDIERLVDRNGRTVRSLIHLGEELNVLQETTENSYIVNPSLEDDIRQASIEQRHTLLQTYLERYEPFTAFLSFVIKGYTADEAAERVDILYDLGIASEKIKKQFVTLGKYTGLVEEDEDEIAVYADEDPLSEEYITQLRDASSSSINARVFLEDRIGEEIIAYMDHETVEDLIEALLIFRESPRNSIQSASRAVEDFQRELVSDYGDGDGYSSATGIGKLAMAIHREEDWSFKRHLHGGNYLGGMRNPSGGHGKNTETLERWEIHEEVALGYILAAMHYIRSVYYAAVQSRQVL